MRKFIVSIIMLFVFCFGVLPKAQALDPTPVGKWNVIIYSEPDLSRGITIGYCFLSNSTWFQIGTPTFRGDWFQKGDRIRWYGGSINSTASTVYFGQFVSNLAATGETAFLDNHAIQHVTLLLGNWIMTKVSDTCP